MKDGIDVCDHVLRYHRRVDAFCQIPIPANHEFIISTDPKYSEIGDDKVIFVDYVGRSLSLDRREQTMILF